jgi:hypothetical protein
VTIHQVQIPETDWDEFMVWLGEQRKYEDEVDEHERMNNYARGV